MQQPGHARPRRQAPGARQGSSVVPGPAALVSVLSSDPQWPRTPREAPGRTARPARSVPTRAACPPAHFWPGRKTCFCGRPWAVVGGTETCLFREALPAGVSLPCPFARGTSSFSVARGSPLPRPWFLGFSRFGPLCLQGQQLHSWGAPAGPVASSRGGALWTLEPPGGREGA